MRDWLVAAGLCLLALALNLRAVERSPFHPDETRWLNRAHYLHDLTEPFGATWRDWYLTRGQPPLGSYLMGLGLTAQGRDLATNGIWSFRHDAAWNKARGNMADPADLTAGRRTNAVVGALAVVAVYVAGRRLSNRAGGMIGALLLATHPLMITLSSQALSDAVLVLLLAVAVVAGVRLAARPTWPWALALGAALGLGGAAKLSPLLIAAPLAGIGALLLLAAWRSRQGMGSREARLGQRLLVLPVIAGGIFVAVYPYLWPDPIRRTLGLFRFRADEMARQGENWAGVAVASRAEALARIGDRLGREYSAPGQLADWLHGTDVLLGLAGLILLAGLALMVRRVPCPEGARGDRRYLVAGTILGSQAMLIVLGLRSDYARYSLPIVLVLAFGASLSTGFGWQALAALVHRHRAYLQWPVDQGRNAMRRLLASPAASPLTWMAAGAAGVLVLFGAGPARGDDLPEIVALPATPRASPLAGGTPLAATPVAGDPLGTPVVATPVAGTPVAASRSASAAAADG
jgi:hypothetical protein